MPRRAPARSAQEWEALLAERDRERTELARENAELRRDRNEAREQQACTAAVLQVMSRSPADLPTVLDAIVRGAATLLHAENAVLFRERDGLHRLAAHHGLTDEERRPLDENPITPGRGSATARALQERRTVHVHDAAADPEYTHPAAVAHGGRTMLAVPLLRDGAVLGAIALRRNEVRPYGAAEIALLESFADQAVIAIENARLFSELADKSRQLEEASQHKSEFLANMSHELRTPLNAVIGFTEVLLERYFGEINAKQEDYLKDVLSSGQHLLALINDILDLSKVEAGRMELELGTVDLGHVLEAGIVMVKERASRGGIELSLEVAEDVGRVEADERKVKQVLFNLLTNAVKFTPAGGRVRVSARRGDGHVEVAVADTGVGIAPEDQARVFEEFGQARNQVGQTEGTGLGLALVKRYVELHGGAVALESAVGQGSTFTFALPARHSGLPVNRPGRD